MYELSIILYAFSGKIIYNSISKKGINEVANEKKKKKIYNEYVGDVNDKKY